MYIGSADSFRFHSHSHVILSPGFHPAHTRARMKIWHDGSHSMRPSGWICFTLKKMIAMFTIISIMFVGIGIGYVLRNLQFLQKIEKSTSLTIFLLLFVLGISIGSNSLIINNLGRFGWQAAILATLSILGSMLASFLVFHLYF